MTISLVSIRATLTRRNSYQRSISVLTFSKRMGHSRKSTQSGSSFTLALIFGLILALMSSSHFLWLKAPARIYIEVIRSTPMIAQIFLIYYGLSAILYDIGLNFPSLNLAQYDNAWVAGIASLS